MMLERDRGRGDRASTCPRRWWRGRAGVSRKCPRGCACTPGLGRRAAACRTPASTRRAASTTSISGPIPAAAMAELARVIRPGGRLAIAFEPPEELRKWPGHRFGFRLFEEAEVRGLMIEAGFADIEPCGGQGTHARPLSLFDRRARSGRSGIMIEDDEVGLDPGFAAALRAWPARSPASSIWSRRSTSAATFPIASPRRSTAGPVAAFQFRVKGIDQHEAARLAEPLQAPLRRARGRLHRQ